MKFSFNKKFFHLVILFIFPGGLLSVMTIAQEPVPKTGVKIPPQKTVVEIKGEPVKIVGPKFGFEIKVVKDAPYSAVIETKSVQTLVDGNTIEHKNTSLVYRNSEGQTRRESEVKTKGPNPEKEIFIGDPVNGFNYSLDESLRTATRVRINLQKLGLQPQKTDGAVKPVDSDNKRKAAIDLMKSKAANSGEYVKKSVNPADPVEKAANQPASVTESLGKKVIEGVECEGTRTTSTIPAGAIGNTLPINIITEQWYSPELQVFVMTRHLDPRTGETTYRLTDIKRSQPEKSLFEVPANYTIVDQTEGRIKN